MNYDN